MTSRATRPQQSVGVLMGHSSGGSHALACAALLAERVLGVVVVAGMAPFDAEGLDWFEGWGQLGGRAARSSSRARCAGEALGSVRRGAGVHPRRRSRSRWRVVVVYRRGRPALAGGMGGFIDDDLAGVGAWGFDPADVVAPAFSCTVDGIGSFPLARRVARAPLPVGRTAAVPGRRAHLGSELWR